MMRIITIILIMIMIMIIVSIMIKGVTQAAADPRGELVAVRTGGSGGYLLLL